jgi:hypothetical protein
MNRPATVIALVLCSLTGGLGRAAEPPMPPREPAQVLLLGSFHFKDAGLDDYRPQHDVDVLSEGRQAEVAEVVRCVSAFEPTKIGVEALPEVRDRLNQRLAGYLSGEFELPANEIFQLGFRLAEMQALTEVYPIDAKARWFEPWVDPEEWAMANGQAEQLIASEGPWEEFYRALYSWEDREKVDRSLREHLFEINDEERLLLGHGHYLVGSFKAGRGDDYPGADAKTGWYNRNLRIFANLHRALSGPEDRLLVIIGAGHLPILRHAVEASPELELVEAQDYLQPGCGGA